MAHFAPMILLLRLSKQIWKSFEENFKLKEFQSSLIEASAPRIYEQAHLPSELPFQARCSSRADVASSVGFNIGNEACRKPFHRKKSSNGFLRQNEATHCRKCILNLLFKCVSAEVLPFQRLHETLVKIFFRPSCFYDFGRQTITFRSYRDATFQYTGSPVKALPWLRLWMFQPKSSMEMLESWGILPSSITLFNRTLHWLSTWSFCLPEFLQKA